MSAPRTKRDHALQELLTSERNHANDMALLHTVYCPIATDGESAVVHGQPLEPCMTAEDARIVFGNVNEIAAFSDHFCDAIEEAIEQDQIGALFLEAITDMERPYKHYISRHDTASSHLQHMPVTPALTAYRARVKEIATTHSNAWDLDSVLIKPVQRLLKYPLLLSTILQETPQTHPDRENIRKAHLALQDLAGRVNEERRRTEVVKQVLRQKSNKDLMIRLKSISRKRTVSAIDSGSDESVAVARLHDRLLNIETFAKQLATDSMDWATATAGTAASLHQFALSLGRVLGVTAAAPSDAFSAFVFTITEDVVPYSHQLAQDLVRSILQPITRLLDTLAPPFRLLHTLQNDLLPLHTHLIHMPLSPKHRPPSDLLKASAEYLALRAKLAEELPLVLTMAERVVAGCILRLSRSQAGFYHDVRACWHRLWEMLCVDDDHMLNLDIGQIWRERWDDVEERLQPLSILRAPQRLIRQHSFAPSVLSSASVPLPMAPSHTSTRSRATKSTSEYDTEYKYDYASPMEISMPMPVTPRRRSRPSTPTSSPQAPAYRPQALYKPRTSPRAQPPLPSTHKHASPMYPVRAIHPFHAPLHEYTYQSYPLLELAGENEMYEVLKECGHPRDHQSRGLRLALNKEDLEQPDCLLLVRRGIGGGHKAETGWALASYMMMV
ncbi:Dbl homology domain-containing protein [Cylindrobasidium torrendii FP15055 ss-10]|uniref:Dbl homology domain-containing protein n=1 Tax=Cylindrobasidium torrendii FP15055 ss-10 TaxID=1314674 RepID=A0A0D7BUQ1_9AGAR|nr:Dbl homology domain-containing protein [Cylindrobasidium torrendii FP15055 ss-10]